MHTGPSSDGRADISPTLSPHQLSRTTTCFSFRRSRSAAPTNTPLTPGTISISATTLAAIVADIIESLARQNIAGLIVVNGHGGNAVLTNVVQQANHPQALTKVGLYPSREDCPEARTAAGIHSGHIQAVAAITTTHTPNPTVPPSPSAPSASSLLDALTGASPLIRHISPQAAASAAAPWQAPPAAGALAGIAAPVPLPPGAGPLPAFGGSVGGGAGASTGGWLSSLAARLSSGIAAMAAPVSTGAVSTVATAISAPAAAAATAAATPLAHVQPHPSPPTAEPPAAQFADPGQVRHEHAPQHLPCTDPPQAESPHARQSPAAQASPPTPAPVTLDDPGPASTAPSATTPGTGNGGVQMLGFGPPGLVPAPAAPSFPLPRDPTPPPMPVDPKDMSAEQALAEWAEVNAEIRAGNARCGVENVGPLPPAQYNACIASRGPLLERLTAIRARLNDLGIPIEGEPAPGPTQPGTPGSEPPPNQPGTPSSPSITDKATQIGKDVMEHVPKGSRLNSLVDRLNQLHIGDQQQAAEAAEAAGEAAWGQTGGIVNGPNGAKLVLPANPKFGEAIMVAPGGTLSVFRGDLYQFLPK